MTASRTPGGGESRRNVLTACPYFDCMERIAVDHVYETVRGRILAGHPELADIPAGRVGRDDAVGDRTPGGDPCLT